MRDFVLKLAEGFHGYEFTNGEGNALIACIKHRIRESPKSEVTCGEYQAHFVNCKTCQALAIAFFAQKAGSSKSEAKSQAARLNGRKGGRPRKNHE